MSSIESIGSTSTINPSLAVDQAAARAAQATADKANAQLVADEKAEATSDAIKADEKAVQTANQILQQATATVKADAAVDNTVDVSV